MKLAYLIQSHKSFEQIDLLINALNDQDTDFFIHVDKKSELLFEDLKSNYKYHTNIYFVEDRLDVNWGGLSQVMATKKLMELALNTKEYDYLSLLSGQDFPLKSKGFIKQFLEVNKGKQFIEVKPIGKLYWRLKCYNFFGEFKYNRKPCIRIIDNLVRMTQKILKIERQNLSDFELYMGSSWFTITYNCAQYLIKFLIDNPNYMDDYKYSICSDEHFYQIILMNSKFKNSIANDNLRYIEWFEEKSSPKTLTIEDYEKLRNSNKLFARKFDTEVDREVITLLNDNINN